MATKSANSAQTVTNMTEPGMTATGNSTDVVNAPIRVLSAQANVVGTGAVTATVNLQASLDGVYFTTIKTFTLSGTTSATSGVSRWRSAMPSEAQASRRFTPNR